MKFTKEKINQLSNAGYWVVCSVLFVFAIAIVLFSVVSIISEFFQEGVNLYGLLDEISLMIFAVAVIDVCKYLVNEEILKKDEERDTSHSRKAFAKFGIIIATALSLEGLVLTIEMAQENISYLLYPMGLLLIAILYMIGIGVYQKLTPDS